MTLIDELFDVLRQINLLNYCHKKQYFHARDRTDSQVSIDLLKEAAELQIEVIKGDRDGVIVEAGDVLIMLFHIIFRFGITPDELLRYALDKCRASWGPDRPLTDRSHNPVH